MGALAESDAGAEVQKFKGLRPTVVQRVHTEEWSFDPNLLLLRCTNG